MSEPTDISHPDIEALSTLVDGEAPGLSFHVDACPLCRAKLAGLRGVRAALGKPVPVPPGVRESAVSAALDAYSAAGLERPGLAPSLEPVATPLFERASLPPVPDPRFTLGRGWLIAGSVAAMLALVLVAVPLLRNDDRVGQKTSADSSARQSTERSGRSEGAGGAPAERFAADQPALQSAATAELGEVGGPEELKARLGPVADAARRGVAPQLAQTEDDASRNRSSPPAAGATAGAASACEGVARAATSGPLGSLVYEGEGFSGGIPVAVLAFSSDASGPISLWVLTRAGCRPVYSVQYP